MHLKMLSFMQMIYVIWGEDMKELETSKQEIWTASKRREYFFFSVPVCAITASGVPCGTLVSMNRFSTLYG
jgi:hypothetical protein